MTAQSTGHPIFVVGYMHSGTTLLKRIIGGHSEVFFIAGETKYFERQDMFSTTYSNLDDPVALKGFVQFLCGRVKKEYRDAETRQPIYVPEELVNELLQKIGGEKNYGRLFVIVSDHIAKMSGKSHWVEKTPSHIYFIDNIVQDIPDARFIEIVRDPRDIIASKKTRRQALWSDRYDPEEMQEKDWSKAYDPFWDTLSWKAAVEAGNQALNKYSEQILRIRYEDLVTTPQKYIQAICEFLQLEFEPNMMQVGSYRNSATGTVEPGVQANIAADAVARWKTILNPSEVAMCQWIAKKELHELGYAQAPISFGAQLGVITLLMRSCLEIMIRIYKRWRLSSTKLGGQKYLRNVFIGYLKRFAILRRATK